MPITLPVNMAPASPVTYEYIGQFLETQVQAAVLETMSQAFPASGYSVAAGAISNATTNQAQVATAAITGPAAGTVWELEAWGIYSTPSSGPATLSWICYSGGSSGTALATIPAITPGTSLTSALWRARALVDFYSATKAQCVLTLKLGTSTTTDAATSYEASPTATAGVTITDGSTLTLNAVMGSAVSGSSFQALGGYAKQKV